MVQQDAEAWENWEVEILIKTPSAAEEARKMAGVGVRGRLLILPMQTVGLRTLFVEDDFHVSIRRRKIRMRAKFLFVVGCEEKSLSISRALAGNACLLAIP